MEAELQRQFEKIRRDITFDVIKDLNLISTHRRWQDRTAIRQTACLSPSLWFPPRRFVKNQERGAAW